jgi:uncharacterized protein YjiS (DUF1127 family)
MTYYIETRTDSVIERALATAARAFHAAAERYARHCIYRATLAELRSLSDRELTDLGMSRSMLPGIAWQAAQDRVAC